MAMTRRRPITPEGFTRQELLSLSPTTRLLEIGLHLFADDHGREQVNQRLLLANIFPLDRHLDDSAIDEMLLALDEAGVIDLYAVDHRTYYQLTDWPRIDRPNPSRHPDPPIANQSRTNRGEGERAREGARESSWESSSESDEERAERGPSGTNRDPNLPPSPFCPTHRSTGGTDEPCRACGRARLQRKVWDDQNTQATYEPGRPRFDPDAPADPDLYDLVTH